MRSSAGAAYFSSPFASLLFIPLKASTVYRKVGSVDNAVALVAAREGHRMLARMPEVIAGVEGPRVITVFLNECIETSRRHPMMEKILRDEVDVVAGHKGHPAAVAKKGGPAGDGG